jgi:tRNA1Val (adenine37-N6)-methyltransferase
MKSPLFRLLIFGVNMDDMTVGDISEDSLYDGALILRQHRLGYRFSIDAVLLAHFVQCSRGGMALLDLGTGCGVILLLLLYRYGNNLRPAVGIEIQSELAQRARENLLVNGFEERGAIIEGDFKQCPSLIAPESFDLVVCNPPYFSIGSGRASSSPQARLARHQVLAGLEDVLAAAAYAVRNRGAVAIIYPAEKIAEAIVLGKKQRLEIKRLRFVYSYPEKNDKARLVLIEYCKNGGEGSEVVSPLYIYQQKNGAFTEEMENFYQANGSQYQ